MSLRNAGQFKRAGVIKVTDTAFTNILCVRFHLCYLLQNLSLPACLCFSMYYFCFSMYYFCIFLCIIFMFFYVLFLFFLCIIFVFFMYCLFCVVLCIVCLYMCTELLLPGGFPTAVKYIISYHKITT
jgi:hypothetical protein